MGRCGDFYCRASESPVTPVKLSCKTENLDFSLNNNPFKFERRRDKLHARLQDNAVIIH